MSKSFFDRPTWKINASCLRATASLGFAYGFWELSAEPGFEIFVFCVALFGVFGVWHTLMALIAVTKLVLNCRKWTRYRAKGEDPKADKLANEDALRMAKILR